VRLRRDTGEDKIAVAKMVRYGNPLYLDHFRVVGGVVDHPERPFGDTLFGGLRLYTEKPFSGSQNVWGEA